MTRKIITLGLFILLSYSIIGVGLQQVTAEELPPALSLIAPYEASIVLDASNSEWDTYYEGYIDIAEFSDDSSSTESVDTISVTISFSHNSTHLHMYVFVPEVYGIVNGILLHFFGKPGMEDGIQMDAIYDTVMDIAWPDEGVYDPPLPDDHLGGTQDAEAKTFRSIGVGTYFEATKLIDSGDTLGKDIALGWGQAIAVEVLAWVGTQPDIDGPNWGSINPDGFNYIRLDIGANQGDELDIKAPELMEMHYVIGEQYEAEFISTSIVIDGLDTDSVWADVIEYDFSITGYDYFTGEWFPGDSLAGSLKVFHDGINFYMLFKIFDVTIDDKDSTMFIIGKTEDMLNSTDGADFVSVGSYGYYDQMIYPADGSGPKNDFDVGGFNDGEGNVTYQGDYRYAEFSKPMASGDLDGKDSDFAAGDKMFITYLISQDSDSGPNYFHMKDDAGKTAYIVNPVKFLSEGEEPTGGNEENTFSIGFSAADLFIILAALSPVALLIYRRKKK
ncbi:MAG: hypothetical protein ACTSVO_13925 [Candidatus Heimdallarchaeaceae archaeon]